MCHPESLVYIPINDLFRYPLHIQVKLDHWNILLLRKWKTFSVRTLMGPNNVLFHK